MKNKSEYKIKNTLGMFDLIKGVVMILVILFHTYGLFDTAEGYSTNEELIEQIGLPLVIFRVFLSVIGSALMPVLFLIDGYGFRKTNLKKYIKKQAHTLLVPFGITAIVTTVLHLVVFYLIHFGWLRYSIVETFKRFAGFVLGLPTSVTVAGVEIPTCGPVWFLLAMFWGNVIFDWILLHFDKNRILIVSFAVSCVGWLIGLLGTIPWSLSQGLVAVLYICMGYMAKKKGLFTSAPDAKKIAAMVAAFIIAFVMSCFEGFNISESKFFLGPVSIVVFGVMGMTALYLFLHLNRFEGVLSNFIRKIGRESLYVLCVHTVEIMSFGLYAHYEFAKRWTGSIFARSMIIFGGRLTVVLLGTMCFLRVKAIIYSKRKDTKESGNR